MDRRSFIRTGGLLALGAGTTGLLSEPSRVWTEVASRPGIGDIARLRRSLHGAVLTPESPGYQDARQDFNLRVDSRPAAIALCAGAADAAACIRWARDQHVAISVRSGGHSFEGFSLGPGLVIDVGSMNAVTADPARGTAAIGAGARLGQVYQALWKQGLTIPGGACPSVGIAGLTLGGGFGLLSRLWGMTADNLLSLELVDASGRVLTVSPQQHPDLFWACRGGGGGNFGIVTALEFQAHPIQQVSLFEIHWPMAEALAAAEAWQEWAPAAPDALTCELVMVAGGGTVKSAGQFVGGEDRLRKLLGPLSGAGSPQVKVWTASFQEAVRYFGGPDTPPRAYLKSKSDYVFRPLSRAAIETLIRSIGTPTGAASGWVQFDNYGGAIRRVAGDATAFPHRSALFSIQYNAFWQKPEATPEALHWVREVYAAMRPYVSGYSYVNYCDRDLADWEHAYYGANFPRLVEIKRRYDPQDVFHFAQSIPVGV